MRSGYLRYYDRYSPVAPVVFAAHMLVTRSRLARVSLYNRQRDYLRLRDDPALLAMHRKLNAQLLAARQAWDTYDYGEGYFYQGLRALGVTGLRDVDARVEVMALRERLAGLRVLEIGCNAGFLALAVAETAAHVTALDVNPYLIAIAEAAQRHLSRTNVEFHTAAFEDFPSRAPVDAVLSFANHHTYDGNTRQAISDYLRRCHSALVPGGLFLFESHPPAHEGAGLAGVCRLIDEMFDVEERATLTYGPSVLDRDRTFIVARRHPGDRPEPAA